MHDNKTDIPTKTVDDLLTSEAENLLSNMSLMIPDPRRSTKKPYNKQKATTHRQMAKASQKRNRKK